MKYDWAWQFNTHLFTPSNPVISRNFTKYFDVNFDLCVHPGEHQIKTIVRLIHATIRANEIYSQYNDAFWNYAHSLRGDEESVKIFIWPTEKEQPVDCIKYYNINKDGFSIRYLNSKSCRDDIGWDIISTAIHDPDNPSPGNILQDMEIRCEHTQYRFCRLTARLHDAVTKYLEKHYQIGPINEIIKLQFDKHEFVFEVNRHILNDNGENYIHSTSILYETVTNTVTQKVIC